MPAAYRLRITRLIPAAEAFYGSGTYGSDTYGTRPSDSADLQGYEIVPLDASTADTPMLIRREHDVLPFSVRIIAFGSPDEALTGEVLDLSTVTQATMQLHRLSAGLPTMFTFPMTIDDTDDTLTSIGSDVEELPEPGLYRLTIILIFNSGRRLTLPPDDNLTVRVSDAARFA